MRLEYYKVRELTNKSSHNHTNSFTPHISAKVDSTIRNARKKKEDITCVFCPSETIFPCYKESCQLKEHRVFP